jgi:D-serine deaminase-like pyridoxal phosphate-dependent protein
MVDILLGKPMPVKTAAYYYEHLRAENNFTPSRQLQWLIDTEKRLDEYLDLARHLGQTMRINLEIDVGLHRGGLNSVDQLKKALEIIRSHPRQLQFSGLMGYDPHVVKLPRLLRSPERAFQMAADQYRAYLDLIRQEFPQLWHKDLTFNGAGSPTVALHADQPTVINDMAVGSALVKPTTFDIPSLKDYQAASFIATPVLKKMAGITLPGIERFGKLLGTLRSSYRQSYFIYGGYWKADYVYPEGAKENALFGPSTNQSMINISAGAKLEVDDFVFLRPQQSEFVFLQFGDILTYRKGRIEEAWPVF